jgi:hypothetical protein
VLDGCGAGVFLEDRFGALAARSIGSGRVPLSRDGVGERRFDAARLDGCTSTTGPASGSGTGPKINGPTLAWSRVTLPRDVEPLTLTATGSRLLVGGWVYVIAKQAVGPAVLWQCPVKDLG